MNTYYDINKYKNEMLAEQQMYASQESQNYSISEAYTKEGILPPSSMEDTRTATQKLEDMEFIKKTVIKELSQVANPQFAAAVVEAVIKSPLNINNSLVRYLVNNIIEYVALLKRRYGVGIRGDKNDVETMVNFLNLMYVDTRKTAQSVGDYVKSSTNNNNDNTMNKDNVEAILNELNNLIFIMRSTQIKLSVVDDNLLEDIIETFTRISDYLPTEGQLNIIKNLNVNTMGNDDMYLYDQITKYLDMLKKLPKPSIIINMIESINKNIDSGNGRNIREILLKITEYVNDFKTKSPYFKTLDEYIDNLEDEEQARQVKTQKELRRAENENKKLQNVKVVNWDEFFLPSMKNNNNNNVNNNYETDSDSTISDVEGYGLKINRTIKKPKGRPIGSGIKYKDFGICEINPNSLNNDIITIRKKYGKRSLIGIPSKKVSTKLKNIITTISGGGIPKHNDIASLDDEEKEYLNILVKSSKIDRLDIPAPSKDNMEKMQHEFEVMKGQIMAGNDNIDLVKKFKLLIRKLSKMKLLPHNDVEDLIDLLLTLGY